MADRVLQACARDDLRTWDPYDIWQTAFGFQVKDYFNHHRLLGLPGASLLALYDHFLNNGRRLGYARREYPIVRAWAALCLLNRHATRNDPALLDSAARHVAWLRANACRGYRGLGWGLGFRYAVDRDLVYDANMPLSTMTPYALEAFVGLHRARPDEALRADIQRIFRFFAEDLEVMDESDAELVTSYAAMRDRRVVNAVSYTLYAYALALSYLDPAEAALAQARIPKLYRYVARRQRPDGSWLYAEGPRSFIDCFHSCIVLKNLVKASRCVPLEGCEELVQRGYAYVTQAFRASGRGLFRRFTLANKPSLIRFDLYDNAEVLALAALLGDDAVAVPLADAIESAFVRGDDVYSQIDLFGRRLNRNMLRWAVMPYLHALTLLGR